MGFKYFMKTHEITTFETFLGIKLLTVSSDHPVGTFFQNLKHEHFSNCNQSLDISDNILNVLPHLLLHNLFFIPSKHYKFEEHPNWLFGFDQALSITRQEYVCQISVSFSLGGVLFHFVIHNELG